MLKDNALHRIQIFLAVGVSVVMPGFIEDAWSQQRRSDRTHEMVTAESLCGTGKITAPTRQGQFDREIASAWRYLDSLQARLSVNASRREH